MHSISTSRLVVKSQRVVIKETKSLLYEVLSPRLAVESLNGMNIKTGCEIKHGFIN
jgi:hypothetical protein